MWISQAMAQTVDAANTAAVATAGTPAADPGQALMFNIGFVILLFVFFYVLMIRPQQKRMKEQQGMLNALTKGDRVITNGGIIGTISKAPTDTEVEIEIADGVKVTVLRYSVYKKYDPAEFAPNAPKKDA